MKTNLSQKLFTQPDGKRFAYSDDIKKAVKKLNEDLDRTSLHEYYDTDRLIKKVLKNKIKEIFGKELTQ